MAFGELKTGDTAIAAKALKFEIDIAKDETFAVMCVNGLDESVSYTTESWTDLCNGGLASTSVTGAEISWSAEAMLTKDGVAAQICNNRYAIEKMNGIPVKITNILLDEQITMEVSITTLTITQQAAALMKISFEFKPSKGMPTKVKIPAVG
jgi:hypothetical protein